MKRKPATVDDLEAFAEQLRGPMGTALRRMRERGVEWGDLDDRQVVDLFTSAFMEAAPHAYSHIDRSIVEKAVAAMAKSITMELAATADGSRSMN